MGCLSTQGIGLRPQPWAMLCRPVGPGGLPLESGVEENRKPEGRGRMAALASDLAKDPRPFREFSPEERCTRIEKVMGVGRGLMSTSEELRKGSARRSRSRSGRFVSRRAISLAGAPRELFCRALLPSRRRPWRSAEHSPLMARAPFLGRENGRARRGDLESLRRRCQDLQVGHFC